MEYTLGYNSNGVVETKSVLTDTHLFISYIDIPQIQSFYNTLLLNNSASIHQCFCITKTAKEICIPDTVKATRYIYDNPEEGNILSRKQIFTKVHQLLTRRKQQVRLPQKVLLIFIDDIWQLVTKLDKRNSQWLKEILLHGAVYNIYCIVGSKLPFRNLLLQLMKPDIKSGPLNEIGAEITINPDDLLFFRERNQLEFKHYYPKNKQYEAPSQSNPSH